MIATIKAFCHDNRWTAGYTAFVITLLFAVKILEVFQVIP